MIRWTGLAPWEFEFPFPGSLTSTFLQEVQDTKKKADAAAEQASAAQADAAIKATALQDALTVQLMCIYFTCVI